MERSKSSLLKVVILSALVMAGCGSDSDSSGATGGEAAGPTPPAATSPAEVSTEAASPSSPYSTDPIEVTTADGWVYRFDPTFSVGGLTAAKDVTTSPPGEAKLSVTVPAWSVPRALEGATAGRTPPEHFISFVVFYPAKGPGAATQVNNQICGVESNFYNYVPFLADVQYAFTCDVTYGQAVTALSQDKDESLVNVAVSAVKGDPFIIVRSNMSMGSSCVIVLAPDGETFASDWSRC